MRRNAKTHYSSIAPKDSDYLFRPFVEGTSSVLVSLLLFGMAACSGQLVFQLVERHYEIDEAFFGALLTFPKAALSGVGLVFILTDAFCFYQLVHTDRSRLAILYTIAANQLGMIYSFWLIFERDNPARFHGQILASLGLLLGFYWLSRKAIFSIQRPSSS